MRLLLGIKILVVCFISLIAQPSAFNLRIASRTRAATLTKFTSSSSTTSSFGLRHPRRVCNPSFNRHERSTSLSSFGGPPGETEEKPHWPIYFTFHLAPDSSSPLPLFLHPLTPITFTITIQSLQDCRHPGAGPTETTTRSFPPSCPSASSGCSSSLR